MRPMPIYEYQCGECDTRFETLLLASEKEPDRCDCGSESIERVHSTFSAQSAASASEACATPAEGRCGSPPCMGGMCDVH